MSKYVEMLEAIKDMFDHPEIKVDCGRFVPRELATELLDQVPIKSTDTIAVMNSPELVVYLLERGVKASNITLTLHEMCDNMKHIVENCIGVSCKRMEKHMKFDVVIGNPPYSKGNHSSQVFWQEFALKGLKSLKPNGHMAMVHPSRWRGPGKTSPKAIGELGEKLKVLDLLWLSSHNDTEGQKYFKATTRFDMYVVRNSTTKGLNTKVIGDDKVSFEFDGKKVNLIPNFKTDILELVLAKPGEDCVNWILDSTYYSTKPFMQNEKTDYPCIYNISKATGELKLKYCNEDKGHFGIPKVCFGVGQRAGIPFADVNGSYGICQYIMGIVDEPNVLPKIAKAMNSERFRIMMKAVCYTTTEYDRHVIKLFRKDFWKEFVTEGGELIK